MVGVLTLFTFPADGVPEAVAAHPPCKLVPFNGRIAARDAESRAKRMHVGVELELAAQIVRSDPHRMVAGGTIWMLPV